MQAHREFRALECSPISLATQHMHDLTMQITKQVLPRAAWILRGIDLGKLVVAVAGGSGNSV